VAWSPEPFIAQWIRRRAEYAQTGAMLDGVKVCDLVLADLQRALDASAAEHVALSVASAESGYSVDHLRRLLREGRLDNVGTPRRPQVRRADLPRKHRRSATVAPPGAAITLSRKQIARSIVNSNT
jgi:hypothetical protein